MKITNKEIKEKLLNNGVNNLKEFGYPEVNKNTILTDDLYKEFFRSMLNANLGNNSQIDLVINELLSEIT